jgi:Zn-dependent alcohol dehydrogenase
MIRLLALTLVVSLGSTSMAVAGEGLMQSASRIVQLAAKEPVAATRPVTLARQSGQPAVLSKSGMKTRTKLMIYLAAGVGLAATAWTIDHKVVDVTPSSLGTRKD